jgi:hypothetical protein
MEFRKTQKNKKEEGMKKIVVIMLALCLAVPAVSYAGSATSRFDLSIGGSVSFQMGWADYDTTAVGAGGMPTRETKPESTSTKYGNWLWGAQSTGLNFFIKGPDAWGAKTSAFVSTSFEGFFGGSTWGTLNLYLATMNFDWQNTSLMIGQGPSLFGVLPTWQGNFFGFTSLTYGGKGAAPVMPQITLTQRFGKNFSTQFGIASQDQFIQRADSPFYNDYNTRSDYPLFQGQLTYSSGACGKVGPHQLTFAAAGAWGQNKYVKEESATGSAEKLNKWVAEFKWIVPIIPEKNGNKAGALFYAGSIWTQQGMEGYIGSFNNSSGTAIYARDSEYAASVATGSYNQIAFYFTDAVSLQTIYYYSAVKNSRAHASTSAVDNLQGIYAALNYQVSPAVKVIFQWDREWSKYRLRNLAGYKDTSAQSAYRVGVFYYF